MSADLTPETGDTKPAAPFLTVVSGNPTDEDVAVLVSVLASAGGSSAPADTTRDDWGHPLDRLRTSWGQPGSFTHRAW